MIHPEIEKIIISKEEIQKRVKELGQQITKDYEGETVLTIAVLKGSIVFFADLVREIDLNVITDFIHVSSYGSGTVSSGHVLVKGLDTIDLEGKNIIFIEDIIDTGNTMAQLVEITKECGAKSIKICSFLDKPSRREAEVDLDYIGFAIPDEFVVGYGLDYDQRFRHLPDLCVVKPEAYM